MLEFFSDDVVQSIAGVVAVAVFTALGKWVKDAVKRAKVEDLVEQGIPIAFWAVNEVAKRTENKIDDKVALGLKKLEEYLATHKVELKDEHASRAKLLFDALHAQEKK